MAAILNTYIRLKKLFLFDVRYLVCGWTQLFVPYVAA